ncbi:MAG TPA: hypothetical protein VK476_02740 [Flavobacterium sp.]|nr:hypothetical protein [Flavobacterium sp.]
MKRILLILLTVCFLTSCGPHRMKCGARGICDTEAKTSASQKNS